MAEIAATLRAVGVLKAEEPWASIETADGGRLRIRLIINEVLKLVGPNGEEVVGPDGKTAYVVHSNTVVYVERGPTKRG